MVGAMLVLLVVVVAFVVFRDVNRSDPPSPVQDVEYAQAAEFAREQAGFELLTPPTLPAGWRATSVRFVPGADERWHLGMLTDEDRYVGLEQAEVSVESMLETHVDEVVERGEPVTVDGQRWETWTDEGGDLALVRRDGETTTLVVGHEVPVDELAAFTASLR
jgi:hypothetical protein